VRVLVTGHHGYIGSVAVPILTAAGHDVVGLDTFFYAGCDFYADGTAVSELRLDIRDVRPEHLAGFDAVVHLAALSNDPLGDLNVGWTNDINFAGTLRVAEAAKAAGVRRFVFSSSCSMYGAASSDELVSEEAPLKPVTAYAESKVRSEESVAALADDDFSPVFMRNGTAYGLSPRMRVDLVLNNLVAWAVTTGRIVILSDGTPWRPLVHARDIARAMICVLEGPVEATHNEAFNVGADEQNFQVRDLAETVREVMPECEVEYAGSGDPDPRSYRVDFSKFSSLFPAFEVSRTVRDGAEEMLAAYRHAGLTLDEFKGERYTRLKQLRKLVHDGVLDRDLRWHSAEAVATAASIERQAGSR
jgi:nucleoside-diphosphate-sugar epimerase